MARLGRTVGAALAACAACVLATAADAQGTRADSGTIATFAHAWSAVLGTPLCEETDFEEGAGVQCAWGPAHDVAHDWLTHSVVRGGASTVMWHRVALDAAAARRHVDAIDAGFAAVGASRRECGAADVPAGRARGAMWEGGGLSAHVGQITQGDGLVTVLVVATDTPSVMPTRMLCPRP